MTILWLGLAAVGGGLVVYLLLRRKPLKVPMPEMDFSRPPQPAAAPQPPMPPVVKPPIAPEPRMARGSVAQQIPAGKGRKRLPGLMATAGVPTVSKPAPTGHVLVPPKAMDFSDEN